MDWIPVNERLPDKAVPVLVVTDYGEIFIADYVGYEPSDYWHPSKVTKDTPRYHYWWYQDRLGERNMDGCRFTNVTHWTPLPAPPSVHTPEP